MIKATRQQTKTHNTHLILKAIYCKGKISRADIARLTGLTRTTVSDAVAKLINDGLVAEVGLGPSGGGKPPILLSIVDNSRYLIGIDLADIEFRGALINLRGEIRHRFNLSIDGRNGDDALKLVYEMIDKLISFTDSPILGIGIGTPGLIDSKRGFVHNAVNLNWHNLYLRDLLEERYEFPIHIANDSQVAALAEFTFGDSKNISNLIVIKIGRGIGAGIILNRQLYFGESFGAGELGHVAIVDDGELCRCGHYGCLETVTSSQAIVGRAQATAKNNPHSALHRFIKKTEEINTEVVSKALMDGDKELHQIVDEAGRYLGMAVANLVGILNVQCIVIAGSAASFGQTLLDPIKREVKRRSLAALADETNIEITSLGPDIVILGAAALLLTHELGLP
ncbi:MAG: ROK family protein [Candidatus Aenigmarchaeota archaeon]|nr:ROK family protein [Candidatus Aenigmarchaeota archaeon]